MNNANFIQEYMNQYFDEVEPKAFYREIFPPGELASHQEKEVKGKYNAIAVELLPQEEVKENGSNARRYILTDELDYLDELLKKKNFIIVSPISYVGKSRTAAAARFIYAIAIDLDGIEKESNLIDLFYQIDNDILPRPTYIVTSGSGLHLYYCFKNPIPCFNNIVKQLSKLKQGLTRKIWNRYITSLYEKPQIQSLFQGFRICGGITKNGSRTAAYEVGNKIDIEYLNYYVDDKLQVKDYAYKSSLTLKDAEKKYPTWYQERVVEKRPRGSWQCKEDLYNWWLKRIKTEAMTGHRYYCCMCLAIYAKKCGIDQERLEKDAFSLLDRFESLTTDKENHFTREDILAALELYNDSYITFPIDTITQLTALTIEKNKRNGRTQADHCKLLRFINFEMNANNYEEWAWRGGKGITKDKIVIEWQQNHPGGKKIDCIKETKLSKSTVYRYWKEEK